MTIEGSPVEHLSPSGAAAWAQCPRKWWYRYVERLPEPPPGEPAVLGTFVHRVLELLLAEPAGARTLEQAKVLAREAWIEIEQHDDWAALDLDDEAALKFRHRAWATIRAYYEADDPHEVEALARELRVEADLGGVPFRGFVDLVERAEGSTNSNGTPTAVVVTDFKTGRPPASGRPWSERDHAEKLLQPQWYAAALAANGEHRPVRARLLYLHAAETPVRGFDLVHDELAVEIDEVTLDSAVTELRARWDAIEHAQRLGAADAAPGPLCGWCPFVEVCAEGRDECARRWESVDRYTGARKLRDDAPAVAALGLV